MYCTHIGVSGSSKHNIRMVDQGFRCRIVNCSPEQQQQQQEQHQQQECYGGQQQSYSMLAGGALIVSSSFCLSATGSLGVEKDE